MPRVSESERLQQVHTLWCLATRRAAGEITHAEYEERFWALLGEFGDAFDFSVLSSPSPVAARRRPAVSTAAAELCAL